MPIYGLDTKSKSNGNLFNFAKNKELASPSQFYINGLYYFCKDQKGFAIRRQQLNFFAFLSLVIFTAFGALIHHHFLSTTLFRVFFEGWPFWQQILLGLGFGIIASVVAWRIIQSSILKDVRRFFIKLMKPFQFRIQDIFFISFCAGIGEELLFRASIQPIIGIWLTAIIFVMLHGYLSIRNWQLSIYGIFMVLVTVGFGYLFRYTGIYSAIMAHAVIDIALLWVITHQTTEFSETNKEENGNTEQEQLPD